MADFVAFVLIAAAVFLMALAYKQIACWLNDPDLNYDRGSRIKRLHRRIEDDTEELKELEAKEAKKSKTETGE